MPKGLRLVSTVVFVTALAGAGLLAGQPPQGQGQPAAGATEPVGAQAPTFQSQVEYVDVDVVVTDDKGTPVRDLTRDDFQLFEDGKRQTISNFTFVHVPLEQPERSRPQPQAIDTDIASNERPFGGRLYVLVLDDINIAFLRSQQVRNAATLFIERNLGANDLMAVVSTGGLSDWSQALTSDKRQLLDAVERFAGQKLPSSVVTGNNERLVKASASLNAIRHLADWFGGIRGRRKTMLLFSEGIDIDFANDRVNLLADLQAANAAAARANVSIYAIDPRGLTTMGDEDITVSGVPGRGSSQSPLIGRRRRELVALQAISDETGGVAIVNTNQFAEAFDRIVDDNSAYYVLAYYPPSSTRDGKFHSIDVKTTRPGFTVRSRKGYWAARGKGPAGGRIEAGRPSPQLQEALGSPIPVSGLPMRLFAASFKDTGQNASVLVGVELAGRSLALAQEGRIELTYAAIDAQGKVRAAATDNLTTRLTPETRSRAQQSGLRMLNRIPLPPGQYTVRFAARDVVAGTTGSVTYDLEVPDFAKPPLSVSGVLLTSRSGSAMVTARGDEQVKTVLPAAPMATRTFPQNDEIALFTEVYDNQAGPAHRVDITTTIQADDGRVVFKAEHERDSSGRQGGNGGPGYALRIPLKDVPPGAYVLHLRATSRAGDQPSVGRQIRIVVTSPAAERSSPAVASIADVADTAGPDADYARLAATYRRGDIVSAVGEVLRWPDDRIKAARGGARSTPAHLARTLAMLHLEAAFALRPDRQADRHLAAAESFANVLPEQDADGFLARWGVLAATYDVMSGRTNDAQVRLRRARGKGTHSRHADLMLVALQEVSVRRQISGRVRDEGVASVHVRSTGPQGLSGLVDGTALAPAYGRIVEAYPDFLAARLRLGWALYMNRSPNARAPLEMVAAQAKRPDLRYLANLFLAAIAEREHRLDEALRAYEAAVAATAQQSALLGVITVASALGDDARVSQATRTLQGLSPASGDDPWTYYNFGMTGDELLGELRAVARQP